jgi:hypothetical protein
MEPGILALAEAALGGGWRGWAGHGGAAGAAVSRERCGTLDRSARLRRGAGSCACIGATPRRARAEPAGDLRDRAGPCADRGGAGPRAGLRDTWLAALDTLFARSTRWSCPRRSSGPFRRSGTGRARSRACRWTPITAGWRWWCRRALPGCRRWGCPRGNGESGLPGGVQLIGPQGSDAQDPGAGRGLRGGDRPAPDPRLGLSLYVSPRPPLASMAGGPGP